MAYPEQIVPSDEALARQVQQGSIDAFEELLSRYEHRLYGFVAQHFQDPRDAREVTQDAFVTAYQSIRRYDPGRPFAPWLFTIARHKCIDRLRATRRTPAPELPADAADKAAPDKLMADRETHAAIWKVARRVLPPLQYHALWLRYAEDMDIPRLAQVLGKTRIHVKVLLFRARQKLGAALREPDRALARNLDPQPTGALSAPPGSVRLVLPGKSL